MIKRAGNLDLVGTTAYRQACVVIAIFLDREIRMPTALFATLFLLARPAAPSVGPASGTLVIDGGAETLASIKSFVDLAGGPESHFVLIPTATEADPIDLKKHQQVFLRRFGVKNVSVLHTRDRALADTEAFAAPLKAARGVWFGGGRQWRLVDAYLGTRTERALLAVLARGGVIGGSSAGATIQGSYLVRGAREGNHIMMAHGYEVGFGYLRGVAIDQHLLTRRRQDDLVEVIDRKPELLGLGLDEPAAIVVRGDHLEVIGHGVVGIYDGKEHDGKRYYFLAPGERFDLRSRKRVTPSPKGSVGHALKRPESDSLDSGAVLNRASIGPPQGLACILK
jgi:cyanophycinase